MATFRGAVKKAIRGALRAGERRAARHTIEAQQAHATGDATALAYARHLDAELTLAAPIMRQAYLDDWWDRATPEQIGAVWEATATWAAVGEGFAQATMAHLRAEVGRRYGIDVRDVRLQGRDVVELLARARGTAAPAPAAAANVASFVIRDTLTGTVASQQIQVAPPPGMGHTEYAARQLLEFADRLDRQAGEPSEGRTARFVVEIYPDGDVTTEPAFTVTGNHADTVVNDTETARQQILTGATQAEPDAFLDALLIEEHRLAQELADHITAIDFATAEGIAMHADRAAVVRERLDYTRLRIQAAQADARGENGTHVFQQASLRARYDDAWWAEATADEAATLWRYVAGWDEGSAKLWMTAHLQDQIQARFAVEVDLDADARQVADALANVPAAGPEQAQPPQTNSPKAEPASTEAAPASPGTSVEASLEGATAASGEAFEQRPADVAAPAPETEPVRPEAVTNESGTAPTPEHQRAVPADTRTEADPPPAPAGPAEGSAAPAPTPVLTEHHEGTAAPSDGPLDPADAPERSPVQDQPAPPARATVPEASQEPHAADRDQIDLPPLGGGATLERLTQALERLGADDVADTLPAVFRTLDNPPRDDQAHADIDRAVEAFDRFHAAADQALPRLPAGQGPEGERWWLLKLEDELAYQARRAGYPSLDREDIAERRRYANLSDEDLRAERRYINEDHDNYDLLVEAFERRGLDEFGTPAPGTPRGLPDALPFEPTMVGALVRVNGGAGTVVVGTVNQRSSGWWVDGHVEGSESDGQPQLDQVWLYEGVYGPPHVQILQTAAERQQDAEQQQTQHQQDRGEQHDRQQATPGEGHEGEQDPGPEEAASGEGAKPDGEPPSRPDGSEPDPATAPALLAEVVEADAAFTRLLYLQSLILAAADGDEQAFARLAGDLQTLELTGADRHIAEEDLLDPFVAAVNDPGCRLTAAANPEDDFGIVFDRTFEDAMVGYFDTMRRDLGWRYFGDREYRVRLNRSARRAAQNLIANHPNLITPERAQETPPVGLTGEAAAANDPQIDPDSGPPASDPPSSPDPLPSPGQASPQPAGEHQLEPEATADTLFDAAEALDTPESAPEPEAAHPADDELDARRQQITKAAAEFRPDGDYWGQGSYYTSGEHAELGSGMIVSTSALFLEVLDSHPGRLPETTEDELRGALTALQQQPASGDWEHDAAALADLSERVHEIALQDLPTPQPLHLPQLALYLRNHLSCLTSGPSPRAAVLAADVRGYDSAIEVMEGEHAIHAAYDALRALGDGQPPGAQEGAERLAAAIERAAAETSGGPMGTLHRYRYVAEQAQAVAETSFGAGAVTTYEMWALAVRHQARLWVTMEQDGGVRVREFLAEIASTHERGDAVLLRPISAPPGRESIWIEHNPEHSIVHGRVNDQHIQELLTKAGFRPAQDQWKIDTRWHYETRDGRVRALARGLALGGWPFDLERDPPGSQVAAPPPPVRIRDFQLPPGQPFNTWPEAQTQLRPLTEAFTRLHRSTAFRHMISGAEDSRPDAKAVSALPIPGQVRGGNGAAVIGRFTALARRSHNLLENLAADGYTNAPLLLPQLRELTTLSAQFAARLHATAAAPNRWPVVFQAPEPAAVPVATSDRAAAEHSAPEVDRADDQAEPAELQGSLFDLDDDEVVEPGQPVDVPTEGPRQDAVQQPLLPAGQDVQQEPEHEVEAGPNDDRGRDQAPEQNQEQDGADEQVRDQSNQALAGVSARPLPGAERSGGVLHGVGGDGGSGGRRPGGRAGGGGPAAGDLQREDQPTGDRPAVGGEPGHAGSGAGGPGGRGEGHPTDELSRSRATDRDEPGDVGADRTEPEPPEPRHVDDPGPGGQEADHQAPDDAPSQLSEPEDAEPDGGHAQASRFVPSGQEDLAPSGPVARIRANLAGVETVGALQAEQRPATTPEQQILARWSGWGAVPAVFDERAEVDGAPGPGVQYAWARERLRELLNDDEYASARRNTINAHFTDAGMASALWAAMRDLGFSGGLVLEPGCGSGNFIGLAPEDAAMVGVEWDPTTAAIAAALYPDATIRSESFATSRFPKASFVLVIGNPPYGKIRLRDPQYNPGRRFPIHTHFIHKSLEFVAPGGVVAVFASRFTMDGADDAAVEARQKMAERADLVGAVRLPSGAHRAAAGTDVVTDVLILRRREPGRAPSDVAWIQAPIQQIEGDQVPINEYFINHPDMVLGEFGVTRRREGDLIVRGDRDAVPALTQALAQIVAYARDQDLLLAPAVEADREQVLAGDPISIDQLDGPGGRVQWTEGFISPKGDGTFTQMVDGFVQPYEQRMSAAEADELRALCGLRDTTLLLLGAEEHNNGPEMDRLRAELNDRYDAYVDRYGPINRVNISPRILKTPEGEELRARLLAEGHARLSGGTFTLTGDAAQTTELAERLVAEELATFGEDGRVRMRQTRDARAARERLLAQGRARLEGGRLELTDQGRAIALDAGPEAVGLTRRRPPQGGFRTDPFAVRVQGLERYSFQAQTAAKTDIFRKPVMPARAPLEFAESPADALAICMDQHAQVRLEVIADLLGLESEQEARQELGDLVYHDPEQDRLVTAAEYLSGDVRLKLRQATEAAADDPELRGNVEALTAVIPEDLGPAEIEVRLGSVIADVEHVQQFLRETLDAPRVNVELSKDGRWKVSHTASGVLATSIWGTADANATHLAQRLLNQKAVRIVREDSEGNKFLDAEATEAAQAKAQELNERFGEWIWEDLERGEIIARRYNDQFNSIVLRSYDDVQLSLPGLNRNITLNWWQKAAVARMIAEPAVGLFHEMGAGKTLEQIIGMMELKRLGLINKPVMCVKNHMLEQVRDEFLWAYPSARVMIADSSELTGEGKRRFIARCMSESPDAVILTRGAFESINLSPDGVRDYLAFADDFFSAHQDEDESVKDEESSLLNFKQKIEAFIEGDQDDEDDEDQEAQPKKKKRKGIDKDPALTWEHAGFDYIVVDESQDFNNLWTPSNVEGMEIDFVRRSVDLEMKLHSTRKRFGERVVTFATGTPITNRIVQFHVLQRYLRPDRLKAAGFYSADSWLATFAEQETRLELKGDNSYGPVNRTSKLINVADMLLDIHQFGDFKTADDIQLSRPSIAGGKVEVRVVPAVPELTDYQQALAQRYSNARGSRPQKGEDTCVAVISDGFRAGQDLRMLHPNHGPQPDIPDEPQKVDALAADILAEWQNHRDDVYLDADGNPDPVRGSLFLVFSNEGVPSPDWNLYDELRELLVQGGMPRTMIRFAHETGSDRRKKSELVAACNDGHVAVLIGSTEKMGVGTNVQRRVAGIYKMHPHWRPDYDDQEDARGRRPGNQNSEIFIRKFITEGSYDVIRAQRCEMKAAFLSHLKRRDPTVRSIEVPDEDTLGYAEVAALGAGDMRLVEKAKLDLELKSLVRAQRNHSRKQSGLKMTIRQAEHGIVASGQAIKQIDQAIAQRQPTTGDAFTMTVDGMRHTKRGDAATHLRAVLVKAMDATQKGIPRTIAVGALGGFPVEANLNRERRPTTIRLTLKGVYGGEVAVHHKTLPSGHGLISRLENRLTDLESERQDHVDRIPACRLEIERARAALGEPFGQGDEIQRIRARLAELQRELTKDDRDQPSAATGPIAPATPSTPPPGPDPTQAPTSPSAPDTAQAGGDNAAAFAAAKAATAAQPRSLSGQLKAAKKTSTEAGEPGRQGSMPARTAPATPAPENQR